MSSCSFSRSHIQVLRRVRAVQDEAKNSLCTPYEIVPFQDGTMEECFTALSDLLSSGLLTEVTEGSAKGLRLSTAGIEKLESGCTSLTLSSCTQCQGKGYDISSKTKAFLDKYLKVIEGRPPPKEEYDQTYVTSEDTVIRVAFMEERADLLGKSILFIGDADLLGLALALTGLPKEVFILDVDERVVNFVNQAAKKYNLRISARVNDVRNPFPSDCRDRFDVFVTDPVETEEGIKLFFSHGVSGLRGPGSVIYFGLTTLEASRKKWHAIEAMLLEMNFLVTDIRRNFSEYDTTDFDETWPICKRLGENTTNFKFYWSAFLRCEAVEKPKALLDVSVGRDLTEDIYRDDEAWGTPVSRD